MIILTPIESLDTSWSLFKTLKSFGIKDDVKLIGWPWNFDSHFYNFCQHASKIHVAEGHNFKWTRNAEKSNFLASKFFGYLVLFSNLDTHIDTTVNVRRKKLCQIILSFMSKIPKWHPTLHKLSFL